MRVSSLPEAPERSDTPWSRDTTVLPFRQREAIPKRGSGRHARRAVYGPILKRLAAKSKEPAPEKYLTKLIGIGGGPSKACPPGRTKTVAWALGSGGGSVAIIAWLVLPPDFS